MPDHSRCLTCMDDNLDDLTPRLCCGGCWSCTRLLEAAFLRGWLEVDYETGGSENTGSR